MREPLLLLPGMMCDARLFTHQMAYFSGSIAIMTAPLSAHENFTDLATDILSQAPKEFALAGLSMGGIAAMEIMRLAPDRVTRLALMDTNYLPDTAEKRAVRNTQIAKAKSGGLRELMRDEMKPSYLADGPHKAEILQQCMQMAVTLGPETFVRQSRALLSRRDQSETLQNIDVPTLVLCGREDNLCPVRRHQNMHELIPGSELHVVEGAGHIPLLEQPAATNAILNAWLER